jgi:hypothetical protein
MFLIIFHRQLDFAISGPTPSCSTRAQVVCVKSAIAAAVAAAAAISAAADYRIQDTISLTS